MVVFPKKIYTAYLLTTWEIDNQMSHTKTIDMRTLCKKGQLWTFWISKQLSRHRVYEEIKFTLFSCPFPELCLLTAKRKGDQSIISSIKPKFDDRFFVDLHVLCKLWIWNCQASSANQNKNNFMFAICTKQVN